MKRSIFTKTFGTTVVILVLMALLFLVTSFRTIRDTYEDSLAGDLEKLGRALEFQVSRTLDDPTYGDLNALFQDFGRRTQTRLTFILPDGTVAADSEEDPKKMESHRFRPEVYPALEGKVGRSTRFSQTVKLDMLYVGLPFVREGRILGCLRVSAFVRNIQAILSGLRRNMVRTTLIITALALLVAFGVARSYTRPIRRMIEVSQKIARGDFGARVFLRRRDELGRLGSSLNAMGEQIQTLFTEAAARKEELEGILSSMQEGLLLIDKDERIVLANAALRAMVAPVPIEGHYYWEVVRSTRLQELVPKVRAEGRAVTDKVVLNNRSYLCRAVFLAVRERVLVTLTDMTDMENLTRMKTS